MKAWLSGGPDRSVPKPLSRAALGVELEFSLLVNGKRVRACDIMSGPRDLLDAHPSVPWATGDVIARPTGTAVSFDGGVVECATSIADRSLDGVRSLVAAIDEDIAELESGVRRWAAHRTSELVGYSVHLSFSDPSWARSGVMPTAHARFLTRVLPIAVLCASSGPDATTIAVRPRPGGRLELAFGQPSDRRRLWLTMLLVAQLLAGLARRRIFDEDSASHAGMPLPRNACIQRSRTRHGWALRRSTAVDDPFAAGPFRPVWSAGNGRRLSSAALLSAWLDGFTDERDALEPSMVPFLRECLSRSASRNVQGPCIGVDALALRSGGPHHDRYHSSMRSFMSGTPVDAAGHTWRPAAVRHWNALIIVVDDVDSARRELALDDWVRVLEAARGEADDAS